MLIFKACFLPFADNRCSQPAVRGSSRRSPGNEESRKPHLQPGLLLGPLWGAAAAQGDRDSAVRTHFLRIPQWVGGKVYPALGRLQHASSSAHMGMQQHGLARCLLWLWKHWVGSAPLQKPPSALIPHQVLQLPNIVQVPGTSPVRDLVAQGKGHQRVVALLVSPCFCVSLTVQAIGTPTLQAHRGTGLRVALLHCFQSPPWL